MEIVSPKGTSWKQVSGSLKHVSVNPDGNVWGVNSNDHIYFRVGATTANPAGENWKQISGALKQISAGKAGVWGVNRNNDTYYRADTFRTRDTEGTCWVKVPDLKMTYVSSASGKVFGISEGKLYMRKGMTKSNPTGTKWKAIRKRDVDLKTMDSMKKSIWVTKENNSIWYSN